MTLGASSRGSLFFSGFRFDPRSGRLWRGDDELTLRPKTAAVLSHLLAHPGDVVTKRELLQAVWPDGFVGDHVLTVSVNELRQILGDDPRQPSYIATTHRRGYRFVAEVASTPRPAVGEQHRRDLPFVGRDAELTVLDGWWQQALSGRRQVGFVAARAGIGKTTLVDMFVDRLDDGQRVLVGRGQCVEQFGQGEAYLPLLDALSGLGRGPDGHHVRDVLRTVAPTWLLQLPGLFDRTELEALQARAVGTSPERMLRELGVALEVLTAERPLVLLCEDLHHSDRSTTDLLAYVARRRETARLLIVGTYRPAEVVSRSHPLRLVVRDLRAHGQCGFLPLELLTRPAVATYLTERLAPRQPSEALIDAVHQRTEGHTLFVTTVAEYLIDHGLLTEAGGKTCTRRPLDELGIPDSVGQFIERQLDELGELDRQLLGVAAAAGVEFSAEVVAAAASENRPELQAGEVESRLSSLVRDTGLIDERDVGEWPDGTLTAQYHFHHALYQEVAYGRLSPSRGVIVHRRIGERLAAAYGSRAGEIAAELAMHFERGRNFDRAVRFFIQAAETALRRVAHRETLDYASRARQLLERTPTLPDRASLEFRLTMTVSAVYVLQTRFAEAATLLAEWETRLTDRALAVSYLERRALRVLHFGLGRSTDALSLLARAEDWFEDVEWQCWVELMRLQVSISGAGDGPAVAADGLAKLSERADAPAEVRRRAGIMHAAGLIEAERTADALEVTARLLPSLPLRDGYDANALVVWWVAREDSGSEWPEVERLLVEAERTTAHATEPLTRGEIITFLAYTSTRRGKAITAATLAAEAIDLLERFDTVRRLPLAWLTLATSATMRRDIQAAHAALAGYEAAIGDVPRPYWRLRRDEISVSAALAVAEGQETHAVKMLIDAAETSWHRPLERAHLLHAALSAGAAPGLVAPALEAAAVRSAAPLARLFARQATAQAVGDDADLLETAGVFGRMGANLWAAETAGLAAVVQAEAGRHDDARRAWASSVEYRGRCEEVWSPVLAAVERELADAGRTSGGRRDGESFKRR